MLSALDQLDLASYSLTRKAAFFDREPPAPDQLGMWLRAQGPRWRSDPRGADRLAAICATQCADGGSYALRALRSVATGLLERTERGWEFVESPPAIALLRWRLPLGTLHAAAAAARGCSPDELGQPPLPAGPQELRNQLERDGAVDGHVHVGACLPFDGLFQILQSQAADRVRAGEREPFHLNEAAQEFKDSDDTVVRPEEMLSIAVILTALLDEFQQAPTGGFDKFTGSAEIEERFRAAIVEGDVLRFLEEPDPSKPERSRRIESPREYLLTNRAVEGGQADGDPYLLAARRKLDLLRLAFADDCEPALARCVEDLLRCEAIFHTSLTQGSRAGLSEFLIRAKRLGRLRKAVPDRTRAVIRHGLPYLSRGTRLSGIELRTAEQNDGHTNVEHLANSLDQQFAGYEEALDGMEAARHPKASWPICLIRGPQVTEVSSMPGVAGEQPRFDLRELFTIVDLTADLLVRYPAASRLVPGLDVAGDEDAVPSWCFYLLFRAFQERLSRAPGGIGPISYRVHAGESFHSPLQGLRRIYEAVRWVIPQDSTARLGHGLALSHSPRELNGDGIRTQPRDEALDDLVWAWSRLRDDGANDFLADLLGEAIVQIGQAHYGVEGARDPSDYEAAYRQRFSQEALLRVGMVTPSTTKPDGPLTLGTTLRERPDASVADKLLLAYLTRRSLREPSGGPLIDPVWLKQVTDAVRPLVVETVRNRNAVIEVCPTSNLVIAEIDDYRRHPIHEWLANGLRVTINTDDPGLFWVTLLDEYGYVWSSSPESAGQRLETFGQIQKLSRDLMDSCPDAATNLERVREVRKAWSEMKEQRRLDGVRSRA